VCGVTKSKSNFYAAEVPTATERPDIQCGVNLYLTVTVHLLMYVKLLI